MDQYIGKMLDNRYEILELIGSGRHGQRLQGQVSPAEPAGGGQDPARATWPRTRSSAAASTDESQAVAQLSHPNIVSVYDVSAQR